MGIMVAQKNGKRKQTPQQLKQEEIYSCPLTNKDKTTIGNTGLEMQKIMDTWFLQNAGESGWQRVWVTLSLKLETFVCT
jgi:hypothetical protein